MDLILVNNGPIRLPIARSARVVVRFAIGLKSQVVVVRFDFARLIARQVAGSDSSRQKNINEKLKKF